MKLLHYVCFGAIFWAFLNPVHANPLREKPDVVACLKGLNGLDWRYRTKMQTQCFSVAGDICIFDDEDDDNGPCVTSIVSAIRDYYERLMPLLPAEISARALDQGIYEASLKKIRETFQDVSNCAEIDGYNKITCEAETLGGFLAVLMYHAREAGIELP